MPATTRWQIASSVESPQRQPGGDDHSLEDTDHRLTSATFRGSVPKIEKIVLEFRILNHVMPLMVYWLES
ncbi:hypothetical protein RvY_06909 [Ramazzottius varieornatus]|uniref:Uncharacterized protein n=1 Tax=Ramazzottius varieornatus TaxID=947166 RepID=A0A1D1V8V9_RAMVA|nr:hypothetical protein RvY_06909 [Ramazzottius varieornatus]